MPWGGNNQGDPVETAWVHMRGFVLTVINIETVIHIESSEAHRSVWS